MLQEYDINQIIHFVEQERNNLFADREVHLCNKLIEFLKGNSSVEADSNIMCLAVRHFHVVWEKFVVSYLLICQQITLCLIHFGKLMIKV